VRALLWRACRDGGNLHWCLDWIGKHGFAAYEASRGNRLATTRTTKTTKFSSISQGWANRWFGNELRAKAHLDFSAKCCFLLFSSLLAKTRRGRSIRNSAARNSAVCPVGGSRFRRRTATEQVLGVAAGLHVVAGGVKKRLQSSHGWTSATPTKSTGDAFSRRSFCLRGDLLA
jgi:hypothetical protein